MKIREELWLLSQRRFGGVEAAVQAVKAPSFRVQSFVLSMQRWFGVT